MGIAAKNFEGRKIYQPGVYSKSYYPPQAGSVGATTNVVAVVGKAKGGIPYNANLPDEKKVNILNSASECLNVLRGGEGYYMCEFFLTPTKDEALAKPNEVLYFRVDPALQASSTIEDAGANTIVNLKSARYGSFANQLCRKITAGTKAGTKAIVVKLAGDTIATKDNVGRECFNILYTGGGTACDMTISATKLTTSVTGAPSDNLDLAFADFPTIGDMVSYINALPSYICALAGDSNYSSFYLDAVTGQDIMTSAYTATANVQAVIDFFNAECGGEVEAELATGASRSQLTNDTNFVFFIGGSDGTATNTDWANCLTLMEKYTINHILVASGDPTVHALVDAHCQQMSDLTKKKNRTWASGAGDATTSKDAKIAEARAVNSARGIYFATPFYRYDYVNGAKKTRFAPFYGAAFDAGIRYANAITISSTMKQPNILGVAENYSYEDKDEYIANGCTIMAYSESGVYEIVHCVSTYQGANLILNLPSMLRTCDYITLDSQVKIRAQIAALDRAPNALVLKSIENYLTSNLLPWYRDNGYLTDDPNTGAKAFSEVSFRVEGDAFYFQFTGIVPAPLHYGFITQRFTVVGQA